MLKFNLNAYEKKLCQCILKFLKGQYNIMFNIGNYCIGIALKCFLGDRRSQVSFLKGQDQQFDFCW